MGNMDIQQLAYYSIIVALLISIPQMFSLLQNDGYRYVSSSSLFLNIFLFGVFTLYAYSFQDYVLSALYGVMCLINTILLLKKYKVLDG